LQATERPLSRRALLAAVLALSISSCVYRIDIQQGNLLEEEAIDQVELGMTRSQVRFLLGTPMVADTFHQDRWDYMYYFRRGRSRDIQRRWAIVTFEGDQVVNIQKDVPVNPS
jgi:outer membrane protein assembly factor BamE